MTRLDQAAQLARTVRHLHPSQVAHRARLRVQRAVVARTPAARRVFAAGTRRGPVGWPAGYLPLDARTPSLWPSTDLLAANRIRVLGHEASISDWMCADARQLWRYHLHYWDWAWSLVRSSDHEAQRTYARLFDSWRTSITFGRGDAWSPYVASLRLWSWCGQFSQLGRHTAVDSDIVELIWAHGRYVRAHLECDVAGNHLVKNLKALIGCGVFFRSAELAETALELLRRQVDRQILPDGGHYERAPAYHCQVLGDLIDIADLLAASGNGSPHWLVAAIDRMRRFLGLVLLPDGDVPLLNDGFPVSLDVLTALRPGPPAPEGSTMLPDTGLVVLRQGNLFVLADVGDTCPDELPAHAHADTLSFLFYDGTRQVVGEAATSTYAPGARRAFERSTRAHSTVEVDGLDSTEVWGAFRAGRRARVTGVACRDEADAVVLTAEHNGYRRRPGSPIHRRTWQLSRHRLVVRDEVRGRGTHEIAVRLVLGKDMPSGIAARFGPQWTDESVEVAAGWERLRTCRVLSHRAVAGLPWAHEFHYVSSERAGAQ